MKPEGSPAAARAAQVDEAVRLQNAMVHAAERAAFGDASASGSTVSAADRPAVDARAAQVVPALTPGPTLMAALGAERVLTAEQGLMPDGADDASTTRPVVRGLAALINQRGGGMSMRLDPPELGELRIQMTISRGAVTAEFHASTAQAHGLLERNLATLRHALESQGLTVDRLSVHAHVAPPGAAGQHMLRDDSQGQQSAFGDWRSRDHDAAGSESRGRRQHQFSQHHGHRPRSIEFDRLFNAQDFGR